MKQLLFLLMLLPFVGFSQTADYTVSDDEDKFYTYQKGTWVISLGPDTLVGADTLIIDLPRNFYDNYEVHAIVQVDSVAGQSYQAGASWLLESAACASCEWILSLGIEAAMNAVSKGVCGDQANEVMGVRFRLKYINIDDYAQIATDLIFKPK